MDSEWSNLVIDCKPSRSVSFPRRNDSVCSRNPRQFLFCFQPQLAAGGVNVVALLPAQRSDDLQLFQRGKERLLRNGFAWSFPRQVFHLTAGNQVDQNGVSSED